MDTDTCHSTSMDTDSYHNTSMDTKSYHSTCMDTNSYHSTGMDTHIPQFYYEYKGTPLHNGMDTNMPTTVLVCIQIPFTVCHKSLG